MVTATVTSKGQVTIPQKVRADMGVTAGNRLDFVRLDDGHYAVVPATQRLPIWRSTSTKPQRSISPMG